MHTINSFRRLSVVRHRGFVQNLVPLASFFSRAKTCQYRCYSVRSDTLAVPFKLSKEEALEKFHQWKNEGGGKSFFREDSGFSRVYPASLQPCFLPFYVFDGSLDITFDGSLGYITSYKDAKGNRRSRTDWYYKTGIGINSVDLTGRPELYYYGGYTYRREYVFQAMSRTPLNDAEPMSYRSHPRGCKIFPFQTRPSFAFSIVEEERLVEVGRKVAMDYLRSRPSDTFYSQSIFFNSEACPARDWKQPDKFSVSNLRTNVRGAKFHKSGVVYLPVYVVSYTYNHKPFKAFVNAATGKVAGVVHMDPHSVALTLSIFGTFLGCGATLALTIALKSALLSEGLILFLPVAGSVAGWVGGFAWAGSHEYQWETEGQRREAEEAKNRVWTKDRYWQQQLNLFSTDPPRHKPPPPPPPKRRDSWRKMDNYEILGLTQYPAPSTEEISSAFRMNAHRWHPDHNMQMSPEELNECSERFRRIVTAHSSLRRKHRGAK